MKTRIYTHPSGLQHNTGDGHPERIARLETLLELAEELPDTIFEKVSCPSAQDSQILRAHTESYLDSLKSKNAEEEMMVLDGGDTMMSPGSLEAAYHAAGAVCQAVKDVSEGQLKRAFCMNRPPGHHAEPDHAMGFCYFNNVFLGALQARSEGFEKIAIVDFDVHHGNGTDTMTRLHSREDIFFVSSHEWPLFPNTGNPNDNIKNMIMNETLPSRSGSAYFRQIYETKIFPALESYSPDILFISAGFDAHKNDALSTVELENEDYDWISKNLVEISNNHCDGRIISVLEGGYNLQALKDCVKLHLLALSEADTFN